MICKPLVSKYKYNLDSDTETTRQLITSPGHELVSIMITAGGFGAAARLYDSASGVGEINQSILIACNAGESSSFNPVQPIPLNNGLYIVMEQGTPGGAELFIQYN